MKQQGRWAEIVRVCITGLNLCPDDLNTRLILAEAYFQSGFICLAEQETNRVRLDLKRLSDCCNRQLQILEFGQLDVTSLDSKVSDLATPTVAELYLSQGRSREAIAIYERILKENPGNNAAMTRLGEIKSSLTLPINPEGWDVDDSTEIKLYMIAILEDWMARIRNKQDA
jgi:tetratricopeptide (TPR) repeat protein